MHLPLLLLAATVNTADSDAYLTAARRPPKPLTAAQARRVDELLASMSLREKVGQMTQLAIGRVTTGEGAALRPDPDAIEKVVVRDGVGSILNVKDVALPPAKWHEIVGALQAAAARTPHQIPVMYGIDSIHGANYVAGSELFPQPLALAATWNPPLVERASALAAAQTRAAALPWNFSPVLDLARQPLWPRVYETYGEDPHLASVLGAATIRGYQGEDPAAPDRVAACLKHYVGYGVPVSGRDRDPAVIPEHELRELHLEPFRAGVAAGALSVMVNSADVNGIPVHVDRRLLTDVLRGELHFDGVAVSDWEDIKKLVTVHRVAATEKEATRRAILAGIDMSMVPNDDSFGRLLLELAEEGAVPRARIDEAVRRILVMKMRLGLFDDPMAGAKATVDAGEARRVAREAARESITLLKNEGGVLPLKAGMRLLVTGPTCDSRRALRNGWSSTWQGDREDGDAPTIVAALRAAFGADHVQHVPGATYDRDLDVDAAARAAHGADAVVVCLGEMAYAETPGNIEDLDLPEAQVRLTRAVAAAGKPVIVVLVEGRARVVRRLADAAQSIVMAYNPGDEGATALAEVLSGAVNPSGRLPITYPRASNALATYDHRATEERDTKFGMEGFPPQFAFGSGLSYTRFEYRDLALTPAADGSVAVAVTVRNTGARAGAEVVQLYVADEFASVPPRVQRLKRFLKVPLEPGADKRVAFTLRRDDFGFVGLDGRPVVEPGWFTVTVGGQSGRVELR